MFIKWENELIDGCEIFIKKIVEEWRCKFFFDLYVIYGLKVLLFFFSKVWIGRNFFSVNFGVGKVIILYYFYFELFDKKGCECFEKIVRKWDLI